MMAVTTMPLRCDPDGIPAATRRPAADPFSLAYGVSLNFDQPIPLHEAADLHQG